MATWTEAEKDYWRERLERAFDKAEDSVDEYAIGFIKGALSELEAYGKISAVCRLALEQFSEYFE